VLPAYQEYHLHKVELDPCYILHHEKRVQKLQRGNCTCSQIKTKCSSQPRILKAIETVWALISQCLKIQANFSKRRGKNIRILKKVTHAGRIDAASCEQVPSTKAERYFIDKHEKIDRAVYIKGYQDTEDLPKQ